MLEPRRRTQLVISPRTVEYHLQQVFAKLAISYRNQLDPSFLAGREKHSRLTDTAHRSAELGVSANSLHTRIPLD